MSKTGETNQLSQSKAVFLFPSRELTSQMLSDDNKQVLKGKRDNECVLKRLAKIHIRNAF